MTANEVRTAKIRVDTWSQAVHIVKESAAAEFLGKKNKRAKFLRKLAARMRQKQDEWQHCLDASESGGPPLIGPDIPNLWPEDRIAEIMASKGGAA